MWKRVAAVGSSTALIGALLTGALSIPASAAACSIAPSQPPQVAGVHQISTPGHIEWIKGGLSGTATAQLADDYVMTQDIDMGGCEWSTVIGSGASGNFFTGEFDGGGFVISGLDINGNLLYAGLFGAVAGSAVIQDLGFVGTVTNTTSSSSGRTGGLIGGVFNNTQITNVHATGSVSGGAGDGVGGLIGYVSASAAQVSRSSASGDVTGNGQDVGGLIGFAQNVTVDNSYARGNLLNASNNAGGIFGRIQSGVSLSYSYATGTVVNVTSDGGLYGAGSLTPTDSYFDRTNNPSFSTPAGAPKTTAELQDIATFSTWSIASGYDASSTWGICSALNDGYPFLTGAYRSDPCSSGGDGATSSAPPARYTFVFKLPDGSECSSIGPTTVIDGEDYVLPGVDADCRTMPGATVGGWTIPVPLDFTGAGSAHAPFNPGHVVEVSGSQQFTVVPFEPLLSLTLDSNVLADEACEANEVEFVDEANREEYSWVPRGDIAMARLPMVAACQPPGYTLAGWNTASDGSGTMFEPGAGLPSEWATDKANRYRLFAIWSRS